MIDYPFLYEKVCSWTDEENLEDKKQLGSGGFSNVYKLNDNKALKQMKNNDKDSIKIYLREAETLRSIKHNLIIQLNGISFKENMVQLQFLCLNSLPKEMCDELANLIMRSLGSSISYLHFYGIFHFDIKKSNICSTSNYVPILLDTGSSKKQESKNDQSKVYKTQGAYSEKIGVSSFQDVFQASKVLQACIKDKKSDDVPIVEHSVCDFINKIRSENPAIMPSECSVLDFFLTHYFKISSSRLGDGEVFKRANAEIRASSQYQSINFPDDQNEFKILNAAILGDLDTVLTYAVQNKQNPISNYCFGLMYISANQEEYGNKKLRYNPLMALYYFSAAGYYDNVRNITKDLEVEVLKEIKGVEILQKNRKKINPIIEIMLEKVSDKEIINRYLYRDDVGAFIDLQKHCSITVQEAVIELIKRLNDIMLEEKRELKISTNYILENQKKHYEAYGKYTKTRVNNRNIDLDLEITEIIGELHPIGKYDVTITDENNDNIKIQVKAKIARDFVLSGTLTKKFKHIEIKTSQNRYEIELVPIHFEISDKIIKDQKASMFKYSSSDLFDYVPDAIALLDPLGHMMDNPTDDYLLRRGQAIISRKDTEDWINHAISCFSHVFDYDVAKFNMAICIEIDGFDQKTRDQYLNGVKALKEEKEKLLRILKL